MSGYLLGGLILLGLVWLALVPTAFFIGARRRAKPPADEIKRPRMYLRAVVSSQQSGPFNLVEIYLMGPGIDGKVSYPVTRADARRFLPGQLVNLYIEPQP